MKECKQAKATEVTIGEYKFYIRPFSAFTSARVGGDVLCAIGPFVSAILSGGAVSEEEVEAGNVPIDANAITNAIMSIKGEKFESVIKELIVDYENVAYCDKDETFGAITLDKSSADEVFCADLASMIRLCVEVIKLNFGGFFTSTGIRFGSLLTK